jgi:hypothetical protein
MAMNAWVLSNRHNEQKVIVRARRHTLLEWDKLQVDLQYTLAMPKPAFVRLTFSHILRFLGMTAWNVGSIPLNVQAKLERNEDLGVIIRAT